MLIPYSTDRELERTPWATITLIGVCTVIEGISLAYPGLREVLATNPAHFRFWQPLTAMFAHADPMHLIGNMLFLWVFGSHIEDTVGIPKYLLLYVTAGFAGTWLQGLTDVLFFDTVRAGIGASGAIMGLLAPFAMRYRNVKVNILFINYVLTTFQVRALYVGLFYFCMDIVTGSGMALAGINGMVANFAHVGGFICGLFWAAAMRMPAAATIQETRETAAGYAAGGAYKAAADELQTAIKRDPMNPELREEAARYLSHRPEHAAEACAEWSAALRLRLKRDEPETALDDWQEARRVFRPEMFDPVVALQMATLAEKRGLVQETADIYAGITVGHPTFAAAPRTTLKLAELVLREGHPPQAKLWYEYLREVWPDADEAPQAEKQLAALSA